LRIAAFVDDTRKQPNESLAASITRKTREFQQTFLKAAALTTSLASFAVGTAALFSPDPAAMLIACIAGLLLNAGTFALAHRGQVFIGGNLYLYGIVVVAGVATLSNSVNETSSIPSLGLVFVVIVSLATLLLGVRAAAGVCALSVAFILVAAVNVSLRGAPAAELGMQLATALTIFTVGVSCVTLFVRHTTQNLETLQSHALDIDRVVESARRITEGDLTDEIGGESSVSVVVRDMVGSLRRMVLEIRQHASRLAAATTEIAAMARQQEQGAIGQASAVAEVRQTLESLLHASERVADSTKDVFGSVEMTQLTNQTILERIQGLDAHVRRISEILGIIKDIANKSEILALNASLEGAKAGEAGRGFSLVAGQMQKLAENVMESVKDVRALTENIQQATSATVSATREGTELAVAATQAARQINVITQQQRSSTEQVTHAMNDIAEVASQVSAGTSQTLEATRALTRQAEGLNDLVLGFRT
jgi:methyl-accepting chemotaxis protein